MGLAEAEDGGTAGGKGQRPKKNSITGNRKSRNKKEMDWEGVGE